MKINLRESLNKIDLATDNKYDLLNTFNCNNISNDKKKKLAEALNKNASAKTISRMLNESYDKYGSLKESLSEDYGGAYDIENDMFFTKEEVVDFAYEICEYLEDIFGYQYDINNVYMDGPRKLYINIYDNNYIEVESTFDIDMRKIRKPSDLSKVYGLTIENWFQKAFAREYRDAGLDESLKEAKIIEPKYRDGDAVFVGDASGYHGTFLIKGDFRNIPEELYHNIRQITKYGNLDKPYYKVEYRIDSDHLFEEDYRKFFEYITPILKDAGIDVLKSEKDIEYDESLKESKQLKESSDITDNGYSYTLHYEDIGNGKEYDYTLGYDEVVDYLMELAWANGDGPEDLNEDEYLEWVMDNFDELADKYELNVLNYFEDEASQYEYDHRYDEP